MKLSIALSLLASTTAASASLLRKMESSSDQCPNPTVRGPYPVGYSGTSANNVTVSGRQMGDIIGSPVTSLPYALWYPAEASGEGPARITFPGNFTVLDYDLPGALADPELAAPPGAVCFPLVISSHGNKADGYNYHELHRQLASRGFIVAAPTHVGNSGADEFAKLAGLLSSGFPDAAIVATIKDLLSGSSGSGDCAEKRQAPAYDQPRDVSAVLTAVLAGRFGSNICHDRIAVIGHSLGAFTALAVANGYKPVTPGFETYERDERIKAAVAMAPLTKGIFKPGLVDLKRSAVPTLLLSGTKDDVAPIDDTTNPVWKKLQCSTEETYRVDLEGAGNDIYTDVCYQVEEVVGPAVFAALGAAPSKNACFGVIFTPTSDPTTAVLCLVYLSVLEDYVNAGCIPTAEGYLATDVGKPAAIGYVTSFLESTIGDEDCFEEYLTEEYADEKGLPVVVDTLFLEESVEDICDSN